MKSNTRKLDTMMRALRKMNGMKVRWGFSNEDTHPEPRGYTGMADIAAAVEYGHDNGGIFEGTTTPPRPFFQTALNDAENHRRIRALIKKLQRDVLNGKISPEEKLRQIGELLKLQVQESIFDFSDPPIEDSTMAMREVRGHGFDDDPLIETGALFESVRYEVTDS